MQGGADRHEDRLEAAWRLALALRLGDAPGAERVVHAALRAQPDFAAIPADRVDRLIVLRARQMRASQAPTDVDDAPSRERPERPSIRQRLEAARARHRANRLGGGASTAPAAHAQSAAAPEAQRDASARPALVRRLLAALAPLDEQPREAWIFVRVFRRNLRWASRAMDCSTSAVARHLSNADDALRPQLGESASSEASAALAHWLGEAAPAGLHRLRAGAHRRRRKRQAARAVKLATAIVLILAAVGAAVALIIRASSGASP